MEKKKITKSSDNGLSGLAFGALVTVLVIATLGWATMYNNNPDQAATPDKQVEEPLKTSQEGVNDGIDVSTGFVAEGDYQIVKANCLGCHSSKLILQNRATREGWEDMIRWMQATQKLHDLGPMEDKILDYLATHYAPEEEGRRRNLVVEEWYEIKE